MPSPITCHVLNTVAGTPAADLEATLTLLQGGPASALDATFLSITNADGRITEWGATNSGSTVSEIMSKFDDGEKIAWSIKFNIGPWYEGLGVESFWPEVEVKFYVKKGERHYHVPVLVGPWTYTTYRGS